MKKTETLNKEFKKDLERLLNSHCIENKCDMPDFLLAEMIVNFISAVGEPIKKTLDWHGCDSVCHPAHSQSKSRRRLAYSSTLRNNNGNTKRNKSTMF